jgi:hypothetical protein
MKKAKSPGNRLRPPGWKPKPSEMERKILDKMTEAESKAVDSLARYKFLMFGYWAAQWVNLNKLLDKKKPSPFKGFVRVALMSRDGAITSNQLVNDFVQQYKPGEGW